MLNENSVRATSESGPTLGRWADEQTDTETFMKFADNAKLRLVQRTLKTGVCMALNGSDVHDVHFLRNASDGMNDACLYAWRQKEYCEDSARRRIDRVIKAGEHVTGLEHLNRLNDVYRYDYEVIRECVLVTVSITSVQNAFQENRLFQSWAREVQSELYHNLLDLLQLRSDGEVYQKVDSLPMLLVRCGLARAIDGAVYVDCTHQILADLVDKSREMISRTLKPGVLSKWDVRHAQAEDKVVSPSCHHVFRRKKLVCM